MDFREESELSQKSESSLGDSSMGSSEEDEYISESSEESIPNRKNPYRNTALVYYCSNRHFSSCRSSGCRPLRGQCGGPTCYPRCCPCYNKHFRCCLPAIINKPQPYCIIPVKKCPPQTYVPNNLCDVCKCKPKKPKRRKDLGGDKDEGIMEEIVAPKKRRSLKSAPVKHRDTEIQPYFCTGAIPTQTSTPLIKLLDRKRNIMVDTPIPIHPPCLKVLLKGVFDATCAAADDTGNKRPKGCNFEELCKCTGEYVQREVLEDDSKEDGRQGWDKGNRGCIECPCMSRGCRGSCGYQEDGRRIEGMTKAPRREPCISKCGYYTVKAAERDNEEEGSVDVVEIE